MDVLVRTVIGVLAFVLGVGVATWVSARRQQRRGTPVPDESAGQSPPQEDDPDDLSPAQHAPPAGMVVSDATAARLAGWLLDAAAQIEPGELRRHLVGGVRDLGVVVIAPKELEPYDPASHIVDRPIRTADPVRHDTVAYLLAPGLRSNAGDVIRQATIRRYAYRGARAPDGPD